MGGFFGIVSKSPCANTLFYGTDYHSHMGTKRAGLATMNEQRIIRRSIHRIENSYFRNKFEDELSDFYGNSGIGIISDNEPQPIVLRSHMGTFAIVTVGKINNLEELGEELLSRGINFSELSTGQINPTEVVGHLITLGQSFADGIRLVQEKIRGSCSMLLLTQDGIIAARDRYGRTPIVIGVRRKNGHSPIPFEKNLAEAGPSGTPENMPAPESQSATMQGGPAAAHRSRADGVQATAQVGRANGAQAAAQTGTAVPAGELTAVAFASESCSFPNLDLQLVRFLGPGEAILAQNTLPTDPAQPGMPLLQQLLPPREKLQICSFLWVYYGFPTSAYEGINVEEVRFRNGVLMGREEETPIDSVCSIPDSGTGMAMGYAVGKGVPFRQAVAKYTPTWPRSFMPADKERRALVARMKLLPNADVIRDARLVCCDDSIVRGTQLKNNVSVFMRNGAREIHVRISCPPLIFKCPFLHFTTTRSDTELITRRIIQTQKSDNLNLYIDSTTEEHKAMVEGIRKEMNFTTLKFSNINNMIASIGLPREKLCTYCFDGSGCGE
ncbi:MAG: amidophosphoribosyltransferase [Bacteroidales bacterium]|nr:amidophosphoribosyltransferase [Bacteroidales bacterium]